MAATGQVHPKPLAGTERVVQFQTTALANILITWNKVLYYSLALPFKVKLNSRGCAELRYSKWRMGLVCIVALLNLIVVSKMFKVSLSPQDIKKNPTILYSFGIALSSILGTVGWTGMILSKARMEKFREAFEYAAKNSVGGKSTLKENVVPYFLLIPPALVLQSLIVLPVVVSGVTRGFHKLHEDPSMQAVPLNKWLNIDNSNLAVEYILSLFAATTHVVTLSTFWMATTVTCYLVCVVMYILRQATHKYITDKQELLTVQQIYGLHMELHRFMDCINCALTPNVLPILAGSVLYTPFYFMCMDQTEWMASWLFAIVQLWIFGLFILAAYSGDKLRSTITLMEKKGREGALAERLNAHLLLQDMMRHTVEPKTFIFTINYNQLFTLLTSIFTYIIIWLQFGGEGESRWVAGETTGT